MEDFKDKKKESLSRERVYQIEGNKEILYLFQDCFGTINPRAYFVPISPDAKAGDQLLLRDETSKLVHSVGDVIRKDGRLDGISYDDGTVVYSSQSQPKCTDTFCDGCLKKEKSC
jgi:hypothetical protein